MLEVYRSIAPRHRAGPGNYREYRQLFNLGNGVSVVAESEAVWLSGPRRVFSSLPSASRGSGWPIRNAPCRVHTKVNKIE